PRPETNDARSPYDGEPDLNAPSLPFATLVRIDAIRRKPVLGPRSRRRRGSAICGSHAFVRSSPPQGWSSSPCFFCSGNRTRDCTCADEWHQKRKVPAIIGPLKWTSKPNLPSLPVILKLSLR